MTVVLLSVNNAVAAAGQALAAETGSGGRPMFLLASIPEWAQLFLALAALAIGAAILRVLMEFRDRFPKAEAESKKAMTRMLCDQVWKHTDHIGTVFAQRLRQPPGDIAAIRILVRLLREDLSAPTHFVEQMRAHPAGGWPSQPVFQAFSDWSGQVSAIATQLADLHQAITYPLIREPVDKNRDAMLVYQYHTEQAFLDRAVDRLRGFALEFCQASSKLLEKGKHAHRHRHDVDDDEGEHRDCPCCKRAIDGHEMPRRDPFAPIVLPPAPVLAAPPPPAPAPAPTHFCCPAPRACPCTPACGCVCRCEHVEAAQPA